MRTRDAQFRYGFGQKFGNLIEIGDMRHDIKRLPAPVALTAQRIAKNDRIKRRDIRAHGKPVDGRRGDQRKLANTRERKLQRPRNGRCRECQNVHVLAQLLQPLLVADTEVLLLVND